MRIAKIVACGLVITLVGCTVALNQGKWNTWIGHNWRDYNSSNGSGNCTQSGSIVTCPLALGDLHFYVDGNGIIESWDYIHRE